MASLPTPNPADFSKSVLENVQRAFEQLTDKTLRLALDAYNPALLASQTIDECKAQLRISDYLDGDVMVYWQPTDALLCFMQYPQISFSEFMVPNLSMRYRIPTPQERAELDAMTPCSAN